MSSTKNHKLFIKTALVLLTTVVVTYSYSSYNVSHAFLKNWLYRKVAEAASELDITRTVQNILVETATGVPLAFIFQRNANEVTDCTVLNIINTPGVDAAAVLEAFGVPPGDADGPDALNTANLIARATAMDPEVCDMNNVSLNSRTAGSLAGVTITLEKSVTSKEPIPVNMAYFFKDYARRIPFVRDTAYAQSTVTFNTWGHDIILETWKMVRNIAYGIMAIAMIVVGMMIMTRRKLNPQVTVTVQNALPRIVIALVLITFSYVIGGFFLALMPRLVEVTFRLFTNEIGNTFSDFNNISFLYTMLTLTYGGGIFAVIAAIILILGMVLVFLASLVILALAYVRVLFAIIAAPIQFAVGAIPGKESLTQDWFKKVIADVLSVPGIVFMIGVSWILLSKLVSSTLAIDVVQSPTINPLSALEPFAQAHFARVFSFMMMPLTMVFLLVTAIKMPGSIRRWIMGDPRKRS